MEEGVDAVHMWGAYSQHVGFVLWDFVLWGKTQRVDSGGVASCAALLRPAPGHVGDGSLYVLRRPYGLRALCPTCLLYTSPSPRDS